jgi:ATP adenylyltransferase
MAEEAAGMGRLWAGWRSDYISGIAHGEDGCLFCTLLSGEDEESLILERTQHSFTVLNAFPYTSGHLMVAPIRHESELGALSPDEGAALVAGLQRATRALRDVSHPDGFNVGANLGREAGAGVPGHLHFHAVPRWGGDTNFMTALAEVRVIPEDLGTTWQKLRAAWPT